VETKTNTMKTHIFIRKKLSPLGAIDLLTPNFYKKQEIPEFFNYKAICSEKLSIEINQIMKMISEKIEIPIELILIKTRKPEQVFARQLCMFFSRLYTSLNLEDIGSQLGGKDHSTVSHAIKTILNWYDTNSKKQSQIDYLIASFNLKTKTRKSVDYLRKD